MALRAAHPKLDITVIEINPDLPAIAERFFGFEADPKVHVVIGDGRHFLEQTNERYDVILLDAFSNAAMPRQLMTAEAADAYARHLTAEGVLASNIIAAYYGHRAAAMYRLWAAFDSALEYVEAIPASRSLMSFWTPQNFVLIGYKGEPRSLEMRYAPLEALLVTGDHLVHDN